MCYIECTIKIECARERKEKERNYKRKKVKIIKWYKYPENKPPERIELFGRTDEGHYKVVKFYRDKFDTYFNITHFAIPDFAATPELDEEKAPTKNGGKK